MQIVKLGDNIVFHAEFFDGGVGKSDITIPDDLTVTVIKPDGTELAAQAVVADTIADGSYKCTVAASSIAQKGVWKAKFVTVNVDVDSAKEVFDYAQVATWLSSNNEISQFVDGLIDNGFGNYTPIGDLVTEALGAGAYTLAIPSRVSGVFIQTKVQKVYYTIDGTTPTSSVGFELQTGKAPLYVPIKKATSLKFIRDAAGAILEAQFVR